jgi:hypothetical protein
LKFLLLHVVLEVHDSIGADVKEIGVIDQGLVLGFLFVFDELFFAIGISFEVEEFINVFIIP